MTTKGRTRRADLGPHRSAAGEEPRPLAVTDPLLRAIAAAPEDDEPFTAGDEAAVAEVHVDRARGMRAIPFEEVMRKHQRV